ncbi:MAG: hypothetical protein R2911_08950 [Caldilineaceae bacterium]
MFYLLVACQTANVTPERSAVAQGGQNPVSAVGDRGQAANADSDAAAGQQGAATGAISETTDVAVSSAPLETGKQAALAPVESAADPGQNSAAVNGILNPAVLDRPLAEIMPELFVAQTLTDTAELQALDETLRNSTPPRDPVPISSLWQGRRRPSQLKAGTRVKTISFWGPTGAQPGISGAPM